MTQIGIDRAEVGFEHIVNLESSQPCASKKGKKKNSRNSNKSFEPSSCCRNTYRV